MLACAIEGWVMAFNYARCSCVILIFKALFAVFSFALLKWHRIWVLEKAQVHAALLNVGKKEQASVKVESSLMCYWFIFLQSFFSTMFSYFLFTEWLKPGRSRLPVMWDGDLGVGFVSLFSSNRIKLFI